MRAGTGTPWWAAIFIWLLFVFCMFMAIVVMANQNVIEWHIQSQAVDRCGYLGDCP